MNRKNNKKIAENHGGNNEEMRGLQAEEWSEKLWDAVLENITGSKSKETTKKILERLISEDEKKLILRRIAVGALVQAGKSYSEMSEILWLSPNTISTIKKNIFGNHKNYKSYLKFYGGPMKWSVIKTEKSFMEKLFGDLDIVELFKNPPRPVGTGLKQHRLI